MLAGVLLAGQVLPLAAGLGLLSDRITTSVSGLSSEMARMPPPQVTTVTDATGAPIATLYDQYRVPASWQQISTPMKAAIVSIEDRGFFTEQALDPRGILRAALNNARGGARQGGSTLTQQYVKNYLINVVDRNDKLGQQEDQDPSLVRKLREAKLAATVARRQSKEQILTGYLNVVSFGNQTYGVGAGARYYFGLTPDRLNVEQAALLAGIVDNPNYFNPYRFPQHALQRRNRVIDTMVATRSITPAQAAQAKAQPLGVRLPQPNRPPDSCYGAAPDAGFFCEYAVTYLERAGLTHDQIFSGGLTIRTTMDPRISQIAKDTADRRVPTTQPGVANPFVITKPGPAGHQVLAMVSNRDFGTDPSAGQTSYNQPADVSVPFGAGSVFKIFTAAAAMEQGKVGLDTPMPNPYTQCFMPPNGNQYTHCAPIHNDYPGYPDPISLRQALATSPNVAFTNLELQAGMPDVLAMAARLGLRQTMQNNMHGQPPGPAPRGAANPATYTQPQSLYNLNNIAFTLGFAPFSPLELANVAATLADHGRWCPPTPIASVTDPAGHPVPVPQPPCEQVVAPTLADSLAQGLGDDVKQGGTSAAAAQAAGWTRPTAAKTGTTQDNESVAFLAITDGYAAVSTVYADGDHPGTICNTNPPMISSGCEGAFGGTIAAPTFFDAFNQILAGQPDQPLPAADPAYLGAQEHGPIVPSVVGRPTAQARQALAQAGFPAQLQTVPANAPAGTVIGQTPQGTVARGQPIVLYVSADR
ncbi:transglycosylase domain-containing protein [Gandjariella thermophila]|uniref:Penicillin-binding protein n=1 Tax=Gandjariella thermophila TaxID=1931992 RepID=A0A4D4J357_9PSEU|nr:transglycosylase domain-containing protein [Gandjariella thermophila]GDY29512.1 penicillin-binding protein [Gandjariella thermophila]